MNAVVGDIAGNEREIAAAIAPAHDAGAQLVVLPRARADRLPARGPAAQGALPRRRARRARAPRRRHARDRRDRRLSRARRGRPQLRRDPRRRRDPGQLPQAAPAQLRRLRRAALLPARRARRDDRRRRRHGRPDDLRGHLAARAAAVGRGAVGRARDRQPVGVAVRTPARASRREQMIQQRARDELVAVAFCALVGGQDELVFDGYSVVVDHEGTVIARAPQFEEALLIADVDPVDGRLRAPARHAPPRAGGRSAHDSVDRLGSFTVARPRRAAHRGPTPRADDRAAAWTSSRRSTARSCSARATTPRKNGFEHVVLGLSGGIDSTLVALIAVDALGPDCVTCVTMPSPYSSTGTRSDAERLAENLGVELLDDPDRADDGGLRRGAGRHLRRPRGRPHRGEPAGPHPRQPAHGAVEQVRLARPDDRQQVRDVGRLLDALRRQRGRLRRHQGRAQAARLPPHAPPRRARGRRRSCRPSCSRAPPSAELRPDQRDEDSLPPYEILDAILEGYVEHDLGREQLIARGLPAADVERVISLVDVAEYKRRQQPPGIKVTTRAFGRDRRVPITNRYGG